MSLQQTINAIEFFFSGYFKKKVGIGAVRKYYGVKDIEKLFIEILKDERIERQMKKEERAQYFKFLNLVRSHLPSNGEFGKKWLKGFQIHNALRVLQQKNDKYHFLYMVPFEIMEYLPMIARNFCREYNEGKKRMFGLVQNHFFVFQQQRGTHWVSLFMDFQEKFIFYFDSNGSSQEDVFNQMNGSTNRNFFPHFVYLFFNLMKQEKVKFEQKDLLDEFGRIALLEQPFGLEMFQRKKNESASFFWKFFPRFTIIHQHKDLKKHQPIVVLNNGVHQKVDGNCGTYAIFFQYLMCHLRRKQKIGKILKFLDTGIISDEQIEEFKKKIFSNIPQEITQENLRQLRRKLIDQ